MRHTLVFPLSALTYKELEICPSCPYNKKELDKWFLLNPAENWACRENLHPETWRYKKIQRVTAKKHLLMCNRRQRSQRWVWKIKWKFCQIAGSWAVDYFESEKLLEAQFQKALAFYGLYLQESYQVLTRT